MAEETHIRKTPRATWHEYAGGLYFVTIVTENRRHHFGHIINGTMEYSAIGNICDNTIKTLSKYYPYCRVINHIVMPNHLHMLIYIDENKLPFKMRTKEIVNTDTFGRNDKGIQCRGWLSHIISHMKSYITRESRKRGFSFAWLGRYHDHIVRGKDDFENINNYINNNVNSWEQDCLREEE